MAPLGAGLARMTGEPRHPTGSSRSASAPGCSTSATSSMRRSMRASSRSPTPSTSDVGTVSTPSSDRSSRTRPSSSRSSRRGSAAADAYRLLVDASEAAGPEPSAGDRPPIEHPGPLWRERRSRPRQRRGPSRSRRRSRRGSPCRHDLPGVHARVRARLRVPRDPPGRAEPPAPRGTAHVGASGERRDRGPPDGRLSGRDARWLASHRPDRPARSGIHPRIPPARLAPGDRVRFVAR